MEYIFFAIAMVLIVLEEGNDIMKDFFDINLLKKLSIPLNQDQLVWGMVISGVIWMGLAYVRDVFTKNKPIV